MTHSDSTRPIPVVLDTDIGTDIDDLLALVIAASDPNLDLRAVTTVNGDTQLRARIARHVLDVMGRPDVPVGAGAELALSGRPSPSMPTSFGHEGRGVDLSDVGPQPPAEEVLARALDESPEPVTICALGAYTNLANALLCRPEIVSRIAAVHATGGCLAPVRVDGVTVASATFPEYNVGCDPLATSVLLASPLPLRLVSVDVTASARLSPSVIDQLPPLGGVGQLVAHQVEAFLDGKRAELAARKRPTSWAVVALHDPTVVAALAHPRVATYEERRISAVGGPGAVRTVRAPLGRSVEALTALDRHALVEILLASIARTARGGRWASVNPAGAASAETTREGVR